MLKSKGMSLKKVICLKVTDVIHGFWTGGGVSEHPGMFGFFRIIPIIAVIILIIDDLFAGFAAFDDQADAIHKPGRALLSRSPPQVGVNPS
jgi:uncharacterized membrane protein